MKKTSAFRLFAAFSVFMFLLSSQRTPAQTLVSINTNLGDIEVELFDSTAPITVQNFLGYVLRGDYEGTIFHRSVPDFIIQGGGFLTDGSPIETQPPIVNEFGASNVRGTIAMARTSDVDSATSQFFFNTVDNGPNLDNQNEGFTTFGSVTSGLDIVDAIQALDTVDGDPPPNPSDLFDNVPVIDANDPILFDPSNLVVVSSVTVISSIPEPTAAVALALGGIITATRRRRR